MKLRRLEVNNFRQFEDESLEFAHGEDGITVVHGANGSGKTTLLNAFTWLFYDEVDFDSRPDRLITEGVIAAADVGDRLTVSVTLEFEHENTDYVATREAIYQKRSANDFDGELLDMDLTVKYKQGGRWQTRGNPGNALDQIIPQRLSSLFFFDGEDIEELAGIDNQERIQASIQNIMGLTILERAKRHLDAVGSRFEDEVDEYASDTLSNLIEQKQQIESEIEDLNRKYEDTERAEKRVETEINDIGSKLKHLDETAALQERRDDLQNRRQQQETRLEELNEGIKAEINDNGFVPLAMPLINETAEELDEMRKTGVIPSELTNAYIDSLLEAERCICGRSLEPGTDHYQQIVAMKGDAVGDGVEQSALRIIGHLNQLSDRETEFFDTVDDRIETRKEVHEELAELDEELDEVSSELQEMDLTTESGESIQELEAEREAKREEREELINDLGRIEERIERKEKELESLKTEINEQKDEQEEALIAKRRQRVAELIRDELEEAFGDLQDRVRKQSNKKIKSAFGSIASKNLSAEVTEDFELKIWQDVGTNRVEVDKSTGERQIASLAFIGSLVDIARERYEADADADYFTGGIYPLVMDSPFGALDKSHRRQVSRVIPTLANQVVVFATDSQWEGPVEEEMTPIVGKQYWLDFSPGDGDGEYPQTRIRTEQAAVRGD